jgi:hypothetical protein
MHQCKKRAQFDKKNFTPTKQPDIAAKLSVRRPCEQPCPEATRRMRVKSMQLHELYAVTCGYKPLTQLHVEMRKNLN